VLHLDGGVNSKDSPSRMRKSDVRQRRMPIDALVEVHTKDVAVRAMRGVGARGDQESCGCEREPMHQFPSS
jgi:hypothetical protein